MKKILITLSTITVATMGSNSIVATLNRSESTNTNDITLNTNYKTKIWYPAWTGSDNSYVYKLIDWKHYNFAQSWGEFCYKYPKFISNTILFTFDLYNPEMGYLIRNFYGSVLDVNTIQIRDNIYTNVNELAVIDPYEPNITLAHVSFSMWHDSTSIYWQWWFTSYVHYNYSGPGYLNVNLPQVIFKTV